MTKYRASDRTTLDAGRPGDRPSEVLRTKAEEALPEVVERLGRLRGKRLAIEAVLAKVPDVPELPGDELPEALKRRS